MPLNIVNKEIYILIGADIPQVHIVYDGVMERPNESIVTLIKVGRVLFGGKTKEDRVHASLNHIMTSPRNLL